MVSMDEKSPLVKSCAATRTTRLLVAVAGAAEFVAVFVAFGC